MTLFPYQFSEFVAEETVNGILNNAELVMLPWYQKFTLALKSMVPWPGYVYISEAFGVNSTMDDWTGREKKA